MNEEHEKDEALKREKEVESYNRELQSARNGLPYVGMPESWIRITALGSPSEYVHEGSEYINGRVYLAYTYYFVENGKVIFEARCVLGKVVEVKDKRNNKTTSGGSGKVGSSKSSMPSVDEYSDPEEFYYWNIDDFYDYEDAEEYYYSHGGR